MVNEPHDVMTMNEGELRRHVERALRELAGRELLIEMQRCARNHLFYQFVELWGPVLYRRDRELFGSFLASHLKRAVWQLDPAKVSDWIAAVEERGDVDIARPLIEAELTGWSYSDGVHDVLETRILQRFQDARSTERRRLVLQMHSGVWWDWSISDEGATKLYDIDGEAFLPWFVEELDGKTRWAQTPSYEGLRARMRSGDDPEFFEVYRRTVDVETWRGDVLQLCDEYGGEGLAEALRRRHPVHNAVPNPGSVFLELAEKAGEAARPYLREAVCNDTEIYDDTWESLAQQFARLGWWQEWAQVVRCNVKGDYFNWAVETVVARDDTLSEAEAMARLVSIAGAGRRSWIGDVVTHQITPKSATLLYQRFPTVASGPFRPHFQIQSRGDVEPEELYSETAKLALQRGDEEFFDFLASRLFGTWLRWSWRSDVYCDPRGFYVGYFRQLKTEEELARRGARVLSMVNFELIDWKGQLDRNGLAQFLFENPTRYLANPQALTELLDSTDVMVRELGFRALAQDDRRARKLAEDHLHHLMAAPMEELSGRGHAAALKTLSGLAVERKNLAPIIVARLRDVARLYAPPFRRGRLLKAIAEIIAAQPELRKPSEEPTVYEYSSNRGNRLAAERRSTW